ncbi:SPX domain-containing protein [Syncephalis fuscata]|nr:SPX domain-containing protein [Syncephalis fuscata]
MKFSHQLKFNAVPEWSDHYVAYPQLKKLVYQIERNVVFTRAAGEEDTLPEHEPLLDVRSRANSEFLPVLDRELGRITEFYVAKEGELYDEIGRLLADIHAASEATSQLIDNEQHGVHKTGQTTRFISRTPTSNNAPFSPTGIHHGLPRRLSGTSHSSALEEGGFRDRMHRRPSWRVDTPRSPPAIVTLPNEELQMRTLNLYIALADLESYVQLNYTAFTKILKKYDKVTGNHVRKVYLQESVRAAYPFHEQTKSRLEEQIKTVAWAHGESAGISDSEDNEQFLHKHLRNRVVFARNTVWRDMIGMERKVAAVGVEQARPDTPREAVQFSCIRIPRWIMTHRVIMGTLCIVLFIYFLNASWFEDKLQRNCFALLVFVSGLWAFEVLPLFVTALIVPLFAVILGVQRDEHGYPLPSSDAARLIFGSMFSPVIMLLLGGFTIAAALSKYDIARRAAIIVLARAGTHPSSVLLACMAVATFASMWVSNVAAPILCFSLIQPILRTLPPDAPFARCLVMGIALASNIGGMASPISSPQNLIAIDIMDPAPSWPQWFIIALPVAIVADIRNSSMQPLHTSNDPWTIQQMAVTGVTLLTILLWCFESRLEYYVGDMGVLSLIPIIVYFGSGLLTKEDFNNFLWTVVMLAMGGIALGHAVRSSGLLFTVANTIRHWLVGYTFWQVTIIFVGIVTLAATFISHTVAALVFLPIVNQVGQALPDAHPRLLVMTAALMCSGAMGLPVSGFPNMNAAMLEDATGQPYLKSIDFLRCGVPATITTFLVVLTLGSGIMLMTGF